MCRADPELNGMSDVIETVNLNVWPKCDLHCTWCCHGSMNGFTTRTVPYARSCWKSSE